MVLLPIIVFHVEHLLLVHYGHLRYIVPVLTDIVLDIARERRFSVPDIKLQEVIGKYVIVQQLSHIRQGKIMNQAASQGKEVNWIPLKEAARLLDCSVKTIRRRIKSGTWRSMIEYRGQKAIRLVAREDVLKESISLDRRPAESPDRMLARQALDVIPRELGEVLQSYLKDLKGELDRKALFSRIYLLVAFCLTITLLIGVVFYLHNQQEDRLEGQIEAMSGTLSVTLTQGQANLGTKIRQISALATENQRLAEASRADSERQKQSLGTIIRSIDTLQGSQQQTQRETEGTREELANLRQEIARLEDTLQRREVPEKDSPEITTIEEEINLPTPSPVLMVTPIQTPIQTPTPEKKRSRFLGIF